MKKENPAIPARGFNWLGRQSAVPGFPPSAAWGASPHVSTQLVTAANLAPAPPRLPAESENHWRRP